MLSYPSFVGHEGYALHSYITNFHIILTDNITLAIARLIGDFLVCVAK